MKRIYLACILMLSFTVDAQEDTTFLRGIQLIDEVEVSSAGQNVFETPNIYLLDFYVGEKGKYLLLKRKGAYLLSRLDDRLEMESTILLSFKPTKLFRDCLGNLQVFSADSLYQVDESSADINVYEPNPISFFQAYYLDCQGQTSDHLLYKFMSNSNQTLTFNAIDRSTHLQRTFYQTQDTVQVEVADAHLKQVIADQYNPVSTMLEIDVTTLGEERKKFQRLMFYNFVISKPDYNPLFTLDENVYIFDHYTDSLACFNQSTMKKVTMTPITYHQLNGWQKEVFLDKARKKFYTTFLSNGNLYISELSSTDFSIVKSIKVEHTVLTKRMMVYDGYLYYDYKTSSESSFNKLFRQRL